MYWWLDVSVLLFIFTTINSETRSASFLQHKNKRLTKAVTKTLTIEAPRTCVNVLTGFKPTCEVTLGRINVSELVDANNSDVFLVDKCTAEPGFCLNGATWEQTRTSARCHCTDRYQGDRCDACSERFQGDGCQECSPGFQGDQCDTCTSGYHGDRCKYVFEVHQNHNCLPGNDLFVTAGSNAEEIEACKELSARTQKYPAFVAAYGNCYFKPSNCMGNLFPQSGQTVYLKETVDE